MAGKYEQTSVLRHTKSSFRKRKKSVKRNTSKRRRKLGKQLLEDAPPRDTEGWID